MAAVSRFSSRLLAVVVASAIIMMAGTGLQHASARKVPALRDIHAAGLSAENHNKAHQYDDIVATDGHAAYHGNNAAFYETAAKDTWPTRLSHTHQAKFRSLMSVWAISQQDEDIAGDEQDGSSIVGSLADDSPKPAGSEGNEIVTESDDNSDLDENSDRPTDYDKDENKNESNNVAETDGQVEDETNVAADSDPAEDENRDDQPDDDDDSKRDRDQAAEDLADLARGIVLPTLLSESESRSKAESWKGKKKVCAWYRFIRHQCSSTGSIGFSDGDSSNPHCHTFGTNATRFEVETKIFLQQRSDDALIPFMYGVSAYPVKNGIDLVVALQTSPEANMDEALNTALDDFVTVLQEDVLVLSETLVAKFKDECIER